MALSSQINLIACKTLTVSSALNQRVSNPSIASIFLSPNGPTRSAGKLTALTAGLTNSRACFVLRAASDDDWEPEPDPVGDGSSAVTVANDVKLSSDTEIADLKKALVNSFYGTDCGLKATCETKAEIVELITRLDALNPTPAPTEALTLLNGKWILAFLPVVIKWITSFGEGVRNISDHRLQQLRSAELSSIISINKFEEGIIGTPQLTDSVELPEEVEYFGQKVNLASFKGIVSSVHGTSSSVVKSISSPPPYLTIPIASSYAESWLLTTYLDEDLRISRSDAGGVFVLIKEGSPLLSP